MRSRIILFPRLQKHEEVPRAPFLKQAHERTHDRLHLGTGHLGDPAVPVHVGTRDDFELEVPDDVGVHEHTRELARGEDEFGDEVDGIVAVSAEVEVGWRGGALAEFGVELFWVSDLEGGVDQRRY